MTKYGMTIDNKSKFTITFIQIDEYGEYVRVKLENEHEHRCLSSKPHEATMQVLWMSNERKRDLGII